MRKKSILCISALLLLFTPLLSQETQEPQSASQPAVFDSTEVDSLSEIVRLFRKKPHIAILPFTNANTQAKEAEFGRTVSSMLATALRNETNFVVLERNELHKILAEQVLETAGLTKEQTQELEKVYNVEVILVGDVSLINSTLHIDARLIATRSSEIVVALYGTCHDLKQIREKVEELAKQLEQTYLRQWMGKISIASQPAGAEVYLDDKFLGLTTDEQPLEIPDLLEGTYNLRLIRGGYFDWDGQIAVLAKMERTVRVALIGKPGSMNINSEPADAQIFLDNNPVGRTPMSLKQVAEGEHEIRLVKENFKEWRQKVVVRSFQPTDVKATLEVSPGMLTVNSTPPGAEIYFKGSRVATTPHTLSNIPPGEIVIRVDKDGYEEWASAVLIQPNQHEFMDVILKEKVGTIAITSRPEGATVYLQRSDRGVPTAIGETPILNYTAAIGFYSIEIEKEDYFTGHQQIAVAHKQLTELKVVLEERPGSILVETTPPNARVSLNGAYRGRSPFVLDDITKGDYEVTMSLPYDDDKTERILVEPNRQALAKANFKKSKRYILGISAIGVAGLLFHILAN
ncbi:MAG TPA: FlgO family outer membrane protein [bacterium]